MSNWQYSEVYRIYVGTPLIEELHLMVPAVITGWTLYEGHGGWRHNDEILTEPCVVIEIVSEARYE